MLMLRLLPLFFLTTAQSPMDSDRIFTEKFKEADSKTFFDLPSAAQEDSLLKNFDLPSSPLDSPSVNTKTSSNDRSLVDDLDNLSQCQKDCSKGLVESFGLILKSMTHVERYNQICQRYNESFACILEEEKCGREDHSMFETITSGIKYMCVDQQLAFKSTIECIDNQATFVQGECETECNTKSVIMNWIMRSSLARQIQGDIQNNFGGLQGALGGGQDVPLNFQPQTNMLDPAMLNEFRDMSGQMCRVGDCVLGCLKNKFDSRCEGSAGTLLSEVLVRPIAASQEKMTMISPILGMFVPQPCEFLYSGSQLAKHRIDPLMDGELRRMYAEKELEKAKNETDSSRDISDMSRDIFNLVQGDTPLNSPLDRNNNLKVIDAEVVHGEEVITDGMENDSFILARSGSESSIMTEGSGNDENLMEDGSGYTDFLNGSGELIESSGAEENVWIITEKLGETSKVWRRRVEAKEAVVVRSHVNGTLFCRLSRI